VWFEGGKVSSFPLDPASALLARHRVLKLPEWMIETRLITLLSNRGIDYGPDQGIAGFERISEIIRQLRGYHAGQHCRTQCLVAAVVVTITKSVNEILAAQAQRSGAVQSESAYRVTVFSDARLNRCRTHLAAPSG
jgi:hypothetical protein